ncbi:MAG: hypothetical protein AAGM38_17335 [Pseudomonadota bacterium]
MKPMLTMLVAASALSAFAFQAEAAKSRQCQASYRVEPVAGASFRPFDFAEARARRSAVRANEARRRASASLDRCLSAHLRSDAARPPAACARDGVQVYSLRGRSPSQAAIRTLCCEAEARYAGPVNFRISGRIYGDAGCAATPAARHTHLGQRSCATWRGLGVCG